MDLLTPEEQETMTVVGNAFREATVTMLSTFLDRKVHLSSPRIEVLPVSRIRAACPQSCLVVPLHYRARLQGQSFFLLSEEAARAIAVMLTGVPVERLIESPEDLAWSALQETFNQIAGCMATAMSDLFGGAIEISPPELNLQDLTAGEISLFPLDEKDAVVRVSFTLRAETMPDSTLLQIVPPSLLCTMARLRRGKPDPSVEEIAKEMEAETSISFKGGNIPGSGLDPAAPQHDIIMGFGPTGPEPDLEKLSLLKDIPVKVTVILGNTKVPLGKLFTLGRGGVIDLNCMDGEPVKILINNKLVAWGEVVAVNEELAVRITSLQPELAESKNETLTGKP